MEHKKRIVAEFLNQINSGSVWDLGANVGIFSRLASNRETFIIAFDSDPAAVERNYLECSRNKQTNILPLLVDLTNPVRSGMAKSGENVADGTWSGRHSPGLALYSSGYFQ